MTRFEVSEIRVGRPVPFGPRGQPSAIEKAIVTNPIMATPTRLDGDEQGDPKLHGGPNKVVHAYASAHYPDWAREFPELAARFRPGAFGENFVVEDATEADICLGDRWKIGGALLEVSQGRQPCWKLNLRFGLRDMALRVQRSGRTGWYFRVIEPGEVSAGTATLKARPNPAWPLARVSHLLYRDTLDHAALADLLNIPGLTPSWQRLVERRLASGKVEDWQPRIATPD
ncbi:MOSC domain-containing protein [Aquicoccus sp. G2-2]|uniref:MOSC domain-containing protein n=1 Tax=Aquicoccus sp. G2-2 TaxID=3092120 RepID=UPI002ADFD3DA|nr:MOSC domain-containing protein [Aquicoccus sp. G2-2]MEA1113513.1 MOSC domain-containing protein [Aquicoccus sp. G2-2]